MTPDHAPPICFVDCETTGLDAFRHQVYEVGLITAGEVHAVHSDNEDGESEFLGHEVEWQEHHWWLSVDLSAADPVALRIGGYHERHPEGYADHDKLSHDKASAITEPGAFARKFGRLTAGKHLVGAVPSFDELFLRGVLMANAQCPMWHYHLCDVENLVAGKLGIQPPWDSEELSRKVDVDPEQFDRHTALGDARWARAVYEAVMA